MLAEVQVVLLQQTSQGFSSNRQAASHQGFSRECTDSAKAQVELNSPNPSKLNNERHLFCGLWLVSLICAVIGNKGP
jgi:hypothetical protein